jgi:Yip1-like protein
MSEAAPAVAHADRGFLSTLIGVFVAPGDAFRAIAARPRWEAPLLLAIAIGLAFSAVWISKADPVEFMRTQMEESGGMERIPAEQRAAVLQGQAKWFQAFAWVGPLFFAPLMYAALAGLFLFVYRFFYGAEGTFAQSLAVVAWCFAAFGLVVNPLILVVMAMKNEWSVDPHSVVQASAAALLDKSAAPKPLYALAGSLDLFSFWLIALLSIGYGAVIRKPASTAAWAIVTLWACYVAGKCALAALF